MRQTRGAILNPLVTIGTIGLVSCSSLPGPEAPTFFLCESNVAAVRANPVASSATTRIEVQLRSSARREFELFAKRHYGKPVRFLAGTTILGETKVLFGFRTGRLSFDAESGRAREVFDRLNPPPESPCGSGA